MWFLLIHTHTLKWLGWEENVLTAFAQLPFVNIKAMIFQFYLDKSVFLDAIN